MSEIDSTYLKVHQRGRVADNPVGHFPMPAHTAQRCPAAGELVAVGDFNGDGKTDYLLFNAATRQSAIWYLNNNVFVGGVYGPTIATG